MINRRRFMATSLASLAVSSLTACDDTLKSADTTAMTGAYTHETLERGHYLRDLQSKLSVPTKVIRTGCIIAGAGVAGLSAARQLKQLGRSDFKILELANTAGGNAKGASINGIAHPLGAHYLPIPDDSMPALQHLLEDLNIRQRVSGRWVYDEAFLCHSPQERLFFQGQWQEGLLPVQGVSKETLLQYQRFSDLIAAWKKTKQFHIPHTHTKTINQYAASVLHLHTLTFAQYLGQQGLNDVHLLWYLDYCCRDEYGSGLNRVSAWAGVHYFAARHGFNSPHLQASSQLAVEWSDEAASPVLTWPQGNAFLTEALSKPLLEQQLETDRIVVRIESLRHRVEVDVWNVSTQALERYEAPQAIIALPALVALRVLVNPSPDLVKRAKSIQYAAWSVANIWCDAPLRVDARTAGNAPYMAWDNVIYAADPRVLNTSLGYVNATHQNLSSHSSMLLTHYSAYGHTMLAKKALLTRPWHEARDTVLRELSQVHGDIYQRAKVVNITRYGHAMATPVPNSLQSIHSFTQPTMPKLQFAHSDWAGYSIFEEAFEQGFKAANFMV